MLRKLLWVLWRFCGCGTAPVTSESTGEAPVGVVQLQWRFRALEKLLWVWYNSSGESECLGSSCGYGGASMSVV